MIIPSSLPTLVSSLICFLLDAFFTAPGTNPLATSDAKQKIRHFQSCVTTYDKNEIAQELKTASRLLVGVPAVEWDDDLEVGFFFDSSHLIEKIKKQN